MKTYVIIFSISLIYECSGVIWKNDNRMKEFRKILNESKNILVITGEAISIESGIPSFQVVGRFWKKHDTHKLQNSNAFEKSPSLVWQYHNYLRELVNSVRPNKAHYAISEYEEECKLTKRNFTVITQNIDGLHGAAGSENVIELRGNLFKTRCTVCGDIRPNFDSPVCPAFKGIDIENEPESVVEIPVPVSELPRCKKKECNGLLRPDIIWFNEPLDLNVTEKIVEAMENTDLCLLIGVSSVFQPSAEFGPKLRERGVTIAEFNTHSTIYTGRFQFHFRGPYTETVPEALKRYDDD